MMSILSFVFGLPLLLRRRPVPPASAKAEAKPSRGNPRAYATSRDGGASCGAYGPLPAFLAKTAYRPDVREISPPAEPVIEPPPLRLNRLEELASLVRSLTYGEMMDLAAMLAKAAPARMVTEDEIPPMLHGWATGAMA